MEAIILAGGFGTRLQHVVADVPKPMAPIGKKPFLGYILDNLIEHGIDKVVLAVGYKKNEIIDYFAASYRNVEILYSPEDTPLLTGGAIKKALTLCKEQQVFVINGYTFFEVDLQKMAEFHKQHESMLTIATKKMSCFERYGTVVTREDRVIAFQEKKFVQEGAINGGVYCLNRNVLDGVRDSKFSFEVDVMEKKVAEIPMFAYPSEGYFIDIGIPEDYYRAQKDFGGVNPE